MRTLRYLAAATLVAASAACSQQSAAPTFTQQDTQTITHHVEEMRAAFNAKDPDKVAALFSANGIVMPPNQATARSRESVREYYAARFGEGATGLELEARDISGTATLAYVSGDYRLNSVGGAGEPQRDRGKFVWVLRKTNDRWFIEYVIFNSDFAPRSAA
jgi:uncharacterized protein (TIGR02246 family)